jgi:hypothetical protein
VIARIDPTTARVTAVLDIRGDVNDTRYLGLGTFGTSGLWIGNDKEGVLLLDPTTNKVVAHLPLNGLGGSWAAQQILSASPGQLWVLATDGGIGANSTRTALFRLNEETRTVAGLWSVSRSAFGDFLVADGNALWVRSNFRLRSVEVTSGLVNGDLGDIPNCIPPTPIAAGALWCGSIDPNVFRVGLTDGAVWKVRIG